MANPWLVGLVPKGNQEENNHYAGSDSQKPDRSTFPKSAFSICEAGSAQELLPFSMPGTREPRRGSIHAFSYSLAQGESKSQKF